jgi:hypothetical protein
LTPRSDAAISRRDGAAGCAAPAPSIWRSNKNNGSRRQDDGRRKK